MQTSIGLIKVHRTHKLDQLWNFCKIFKKIFKARIKNGGAPIGADHRNSPDVHQQLLRFSENGLHGQLIIHDLDIERSTTPNSQQHLRPCERGGGGGGFFNFQIKIFFLIFW